MSDRLLELSVFVRAAETGSFSRVAREFGVSQPSVSRMVASLKARLGVKLLLRTTRQVTPTDAAAVFLERSRQILGDLDEAAHAACGGDSPHGVLRVAMSGAFGTREVIPRLPRLAMDVPGRDRTRRASSHPARLPARSRRGSRRLPDRPTPLPQSAGVLGSSRGDAWREDRGSRQLAAFDRFPARSCRRRVAGGVFPVRSVLTSFTGRTRAAEYGRQWP